MTYGLRLYNDSANELTFADSGLIYTYRGRPTYQYTVDPGTDSVFSQCGYSVYTFAWNGPIIVGLGLDQWATSIIDITRSGNTHTIKVMKGNGSFNSLGFDQQAFAQVYIFGVSIDQTGYGISLFDDNGNILSVITKPPLSYQYLVQSDGQNSVSAPTLSIPVIIGANLSVKTTATRIGSSQSYIIKTYNPGWSISSGSVIPTFYQIFYATDNFIAPQLAFRPSNALLLDGALLQL